MKHIERLFTYLIEGPSLEHCAKWTGGKNQDGYPIFWDGSRSRQASRALWEFYKGSLPAGTMVLHTCDNPECLNPRHLYAGNARKNAQDAVKRGRSSVQILTVREVKLILGSLKAKNEKVSVRRFASVVGPLFKVSEHTIRGIASKTTWSWI